MTARPFNVTTCRIVIIQRTLNCTSSVAFWKALIAYAAEHKLEVVFHHTYKMATFPNDVHDDLTDTASMALRHLRDMGMLSRAEEMRGELESSMEFTGRPPPPLYPS